MIELKREDFPRILPLLDDPLLGVVGGCVAKGASPGWIFVDSRDNPRTALIWSKGIQGFYLAGDPMQRDVSESLDAFVSDTIAPRAKQIGLNWFEVSGCGLGWDDFIVQTFARRQPERETEYVYTLKQPDTACSQPVSPNPILRELDEEFFRSQPCDRIGLIQAKVELFWGDVESFFVAGIGFCALRDSTLASVCLSGFVAEQVHVIDIETIDSYQRQGLGYQVGSAFVSRCLDRGFSPQWGCMEENSASRAFAERLGFDRVAECSVFYFSLEDG